MKRRALLTVLALAACSRPPRCKRCGMVLDPSSRWLAELRNGDVVERFDTPKCAFAAWRGGRPAGTTLRLRGYYSQRELDAAEIVLAVGSDVLGPMGPDLVPVEREHGAKFSADHHARMVEAAAVTLALADDPR